MAQLTSKHKPILRIVLLSVAAIPILFIIGSILLSPFFKAADKMKFEKMDSQTRQIFSTLQAVSGGSETWNYEAKCTSTGQGGFQTYPDYSCSTKVSTEVPAVSPQQLDALHKKYYSFVDNSPLIRPVSGLDKQFPGQFGVSFVVSSAEKKYQFNEGGEMCDYIAKLTQPYSITKPYNRSYGAPIEGGGRIILSLTCTGTAQSNWYELIY